MPAMIPTTGKNHHHFSGMCWPCPGEGLHDLEWQLRNAPKDAIFSGRWTAASVLAAYRELITCEPSKRERVVRELRKEMARRAT